MKKSQTGADISSFFGSLKESEKEIINYASLGYSDHQIYALLHKEYPKIKESTIRSTLSEAFNCLSISESREKDKQKQWSQRVRLAYIYNNLYLNNSGLRFQTISRHIQTTCSDDGHKRVKLHNRLRIIDTVESISGTLRLGSPWREFPPAKLNDINIKSLNKIIQYQVSTSSDIPNQSDNSLPYRYIFNPPLEADDVIELQTEYIMYESYVRTGEEMKSLWQKVKHNDKGYLNRLFRGKEIFSSMGNIRGNWKIDIELPRDYPAKLCQFHVFSSSWDRMDTTEALIRESGGFQLNHMSPDRIGTGPVHNASIHVSHLPNCRLIMSYSPYND